MERELKKLAEDHKIAVTINVHYDGTSKIPTGFTVDVTLFSKYNVGDITKRRWTHFQ